jgi:hypothetical protein
MRLSVLQVALDYNLRFPDRITQCSPLKTQLDFFPTGGEVFPDSAFIELVRSSPLAKPELMLWAGGQELIAPEIQYQIRKYRPILLHPTVERALNLPSTAAPPEPSRAVLNDVSKLLNEYVGLSEKSVSIVSRFIMSTWIIEALPTAPRLLVEGPESIQKTQLLQILKSLCRHSICLGAVTRNSFSSLPSYLRLTAILHDPVISPGLENLLLATTKRDNPTLRGGELRDLFGAHVVVSDSGHSRDSWPVRIACTGDTRTTYELDPETERRIHAEFQPRLLAFRFAHYREAQTMEYDISTFAPPLMELARSLAAATPDDEQRRAEVKVLLADENAELRDAQWIVLDTVIVEALLVYCREAKQPSVYMAEIAQMAKAILEGRGEFRDVDPGNVGRRVRGLGIKVEPRDAKGSTLRLTNAACASIHELAHRLGVPGIKQGECRHVGDVPGI